MRGGPGVTAQPRCMLSGMEPTESTRRRWKLLLVIPYLGLCFPWVYARNAPALFGFPFFYWYQFVWVGISSALMGIVYWKLKY
jgi:hypothetical protein